VAPTYDCRSRSSVAVERFGARSLEVFSGLSFCSGLLALLCPFFLPVFTQPRRRGRVLLV
jgi:hypothetical protein